MKPRLLDLFCGAGGCTKGYQRAGFYVVGVDNRPQPNYCGDGFVQDDALALMSTFPWWDEPPFDAIHASPPCQGYASLAAKDGRWPRLITPVRELLNATGLPWVIENIQDAAPEMREPFRLCGSMFGLNVRRHRLFETSFPMLVSRCQHGALGEIRGYYGRNYGPALVSKDAIQRRGRKPLFRGTVEQADSDMEIDWMTWDELREAIPPAYTELVGHQLMSHIRAAVA